MTEYRGGENMKKARKMATIIIPERGLKENSVWKTPFRELISYPLKLRYKSNSKQRLSNKPLFRSCLSLETRSKSPKRDITDIFSIVTHCKKISEYPGTLSIKDRDIWSWNR